MRQIFSNAGIKGRVTSIAFVYVLILSSFVGMLPQKTQAVTGGDFSAGNIMSDVVFFNGADIAPPSIQAFLNSKVPNCDTWGQQSYAGTTRAAYGASRGYPAPYTCLRDYVENVPARAADDFCSSITPGPRTAAQLIYEVGLSCNVNPKVLIVLLQKEQALVTDDWPWSTQYRSATGFGCPDTAACDSQYYGFFNQVYSAARQFKRYSRYRNLFSHKAGQVNSIRLHPNASCGAGLVYIVNQATAGLYNYTPYQPNPAALNNLYGTGDACSSYGNRNFWRIYNDWFGSTLVNLPPMCTGNEAPGAAVSRFYHPRTYAHFYTVYGCDIPFLLWLGYVYEGPVMRATDSSSPTATPVYRYVDRLTRNHIWSTENKNQAQLDADGTGFVVEAGLVFYVDSPSNPSAMPVHRFYNRQTRLRLWASSAGLTVNDLGILARAGYEIEGPAWWTVP